MSTTLKIHKFENDDEDGELIDATFMAMWHHGDDDLTLSIITADGQDVSFDWVDLLDALEHEGWNINDVARWRPRYLVAGPNLRRAK